MKRTSLAVFLLVIASSGCCLCRKRETVAAAPMCAPPALACPSPCAPACAPGAVTYGMPTTTNYIPMQ
jgi:hypothetical protein